MIKHLNMRTVNLEDIAERIVQYSLHPLPNRPFVDRTLLYPKLFQIVSRFACDSESLSEYWKVVSDYTGIYTPLGELILSNTEAFIPRYEEASNGFETAFPKWQIYFEHAIVNHVFIDRFPFSDKRESPWEEFEELFSVYCILRFLAVCYMQGRNSMNDLVDVLAASFRMIEHSNINEVSRSIFSEFTPYERENLSEILFLA